jgi:nucleoside-diphosphate-sugar epimerase
MQEKKKLLITGSSGFVGGYLVEAALSDGYDVYAGLRATSNRQYLQDDRIHFVIMDFNDPQALTTKLRDHKFDYVIHNVGLVAASSLDKLTSVNLGTLRTLVECSREAGAMPKRLVYTSSLAACGPADDLPHGEVRDSDPPRPVTNYGRSKLASEQYLREQTDLDYIILRPTAVYGPHDLEFLPVYKSVKGRIKATVGLQTQHLSMVYVKDLAQAFIKALTAPTTSKAYFVTDGDVHTSSSLNDGIATALDVRGIPLRVPVPIISVAAHISAWVGKVRGRYPVLNPDKVNELKAKSWLCDNKTTEADLGYRPTYNLQSGLDETIAWCKRSGLL